MLLAIDIGNTYIVLGLFEDNHLLKRYTIKTQVQMYYPYLRKILFQKKIDQIIICSVAPRSLSILKKDLRKILNMRPCVVGQDFVVPMKNLYRNPKHVGQDRLVNAYGVATIYGFPAIVVDFGTAITIDAISKNKEYLGGIILPGLEVSLDALMKRAALLPRARLSIPKELIGRDTQNSILSGVVYGSTVLVNELIKQIKKKLGYSHLELIGTGGDIVLVRSLLSQIKIIDKDLTLKGLALVAGRLKP